MNAASIYALTRTLTGTDSTTLTDTTLEQYMRIAYQNLIGIMQSTIGEGFLYEEFTSDLVSGQREYKLPEKDSDSPGCKKVLSVTAKLKSTDQSFTKLKEQSIPMSPVSVQFESENQPISSPVYSVYDRSIFISPTPQENITSGLVLYGISEPFDPSTASPESAFKVPTEYHFIIAFGMVRLHYAQKKQADREAEALQRLLSAQDRMVVELLTRSKDRHESVAPNTSHLE